MVNIAKFWHDYSNINTKKPIQLRLNLLIYIYIYIKLMTFYKEVFNNSTTIGILERKLITLCKMPHFKFCLRPQNVLSRY